MIAMKCYNLPAGDMLNTGASVLSKMHDLSTPLVDLMVRESIQNSLDEIRSDKAFARIEFETGSFQKTILSSLIPAIRIGLNSAVSESVCDFIAITDSNTNGLLGEPFSRKNKPNNFYNLVYHVDAKNKKDADKGGSWGIGKTVYYRFGIGLVFYYSRTKEDGVYKEKLAGVLVQDENEPNCILGPDSTGICYIGDLKEHDGKMIRWPIFDGASIQEFFNVFGIQRFMGDDTGTKVIIPFVDINKFLKGRAYEGDDLHWLPSSFEESVSMAVQRWWFPRLNNPKFGQKYFIVAVNKQKVELNPFFKQLQDLLSKKPDQEGSDVYTIVTKWSGCSGPLGNFYVMKGDDEAFKVKTPPNNLSNPFAQFDLQPETNSSNPMIYAYMRKFGLIVTYDIERFKATTSPGEYLFGLFFLNDSATTTESPKESLASYLKASEGPNHKGWMDITVPKFPILSVKKPLAKIIRRIRKIIEDNYAEHSTPDVTSGPSLLRRKVGKLLLPPSDFGEEPEKPAKPPRVGPAIPVTKKRPYRITYNGFVENLISYSACFKLNPGSIGKAFMCVVADSGNLSVDEWERNGFQSPIALEAIRMIRVESGKDSIDGPYNLPQSKWNSTVSFMAKPGGPAAYQLFVSHKTPNKTPYAVFIKNISDQEIRIELEFLIRPVNLAYQIALAGEIKEGE